MPSCEGPYYEARTRGNLENLKRAYVSCTRALETCTILQKPILQDYSEQLLLGIGVLRLQLQLNLSNAKISKKIGIYETKLPAFFNNDNQELTLDERLKILKFLVKNI